MKAGLAKANSAWIGKRCRQCPRKIKVGEAVLTHRLDNVYGEADFVVHTACMAALVERAPVGRPPGDPVAQVTELRRRIERTGQRFPGRDMSHSRSAVALRELGG